MCDSGEEENVCHMIVECVGYTRERAKLVEVINELVGDEFFMEWNENGMCKVLELDRDPRVHTGSVKRYLECVWLKRRRLIGNERSEVHVLQNEHEHDHARV